ncbi:MAG: threonine dehydratase [Cyclobacteriaceae bacterium]|jgi:threonine dehydratase
MEVPSLSDIKRAHQRIGKYIVETPVMTSQSINEKVGAELFFKCENFQKTGSFKLRGASNAIFSLRPEDRENGFATHSSGNHAQAVAFAAKVAGTKAYIVMPENAPEVKINAVREYGGEIIFCAPNEAARKSTCDEVIRKTGATFIPPFDHKDIIAGQATCAKELIEEINDLDFILSPVGGGGLAAGTCLSTKYLTPNTQVVLGEPENANDAFLSFKKGVITPVQNPDTIADGLRTTVGHLNFQIILDNAQEIITVTEAEIISAMRHIWERMKIVIEPSCAVPFAAVLKSPSKFAGKRIGIILTGGNVDLAKRPF